MLPFPFLLSKNVYEGSRRGSTLGVAVSCVPHTELLSPTCRVFLPDLLPPLMTALVTAFPPFLTVHVLHLHCPPSRLTVTALGCWHLTLLSL